MPPLPADDRNPGPSHIQLTSALATMKQFQLARLTTARPTQRFRGSPAFRWSGWGSERPATRSLDAARSPRPGAGTTNAPTAPRNHEHSRARTRRCRRAREASRPRNQYGAYRDCVSRRRCVKSSRNLSYTTLRTALSGCPMGRKPPPPGRSHRSFARSVPAIASATFRCRAGA